SELPPRADDGPAAGGARRVPDPRGPRHPADAELDDGVRGRDGPGAALPGAGCSAFGGDRGLRTPRLLRAPPPPHPPPALPRGPALAVRVAGMAGAVLPGCECASVPVAGALVRRGVTPAAALAFLLSAPAINPIVLTATAVAFPGRPEMVLARFAASLLVACAMGWLWQRLGRADWLRPPARASHEGQSKGAAFWDSVRHDVMHAGGFLVVGAMAAATLKAVAPASWLRTAAGDPVVALLALSVLAVLLSICSE